VNDFIYVLDHNRIQSTNTLASNY